MSFVSWLSVPLWPCGHRDRAYYLITVPVSFSRFSECLIVTLRTPLATAFDLGDHPFADDAAGFERGVRFGRDFADERRLVLRVAQHAAFFEAENQLRGGDPGGTECHGRSHAVGVAVEQRALPVVHNGAEYGRDACPEKFPEQRVVDTFDVAHEAVVDRFGCAAACHDGVAVGARQPECIASGGLEPGHELFVDQPGVDHRHDVERALVGDAAPVDHLHLQFEFLGEARGELAASVDEDLRPGQRGEVREEASQGRGVVDDVAPDLYYRDFFHHFDPSSNLLSTTCAEISRLAASGITSERGDSITSSVTIMLRRTGRQCMK